MKKLFKLITSLTFVFSFIISFFLSNINLVSAHEKSNFSLNDNRVRIKIVKQTGPTLQYYWGEFAFVDVGNNSVKLRPIYNGKPVHYSEFPSNITTSRPVDIRLIDENGKVYASSKNDNVNITYLKNIAEFLEKYTLRYGLDSIQIVPFHDERWDTFSITGNINNNLDNYDYSNHVTKKQGYNTSFRIERDGLYAQYVHQVRIPNGEYIIVTAENENRVVESNGIAVKTKEYLNFNNQKFVFEYDNTRKAYKIKSTNGVLSVSNQNSTDVVSYNDNNANNQFWYVQNSGDNKYKLVNASNTMKIMNLDMDNSNISIADNLSITDNRNDIRQQFRIIKPNEKLPITQGEWRIASKLNNNKVLNLDIGGRDPINVNIWDNANVTQQKWRIEYDNSKNAFKIFNSYNDGNLSVNLSNSINVYALGIGGAYWYLEYLGDGYYTIKYYNNPNLVLDLDKSDTRNASNIQVYSRNDGNNQKFKLVR